jgi:hypothetical protein
VGPERTREFEMGFDASVFDGRLGIETTYFNAKTRDALVPVDLPATQGFVASRQTNIGELQNSGWEFQLTSNVLRTDLIDWRLRGNFSFTDSEVLDLDGDPNNTFEVYTGLKSWIREGEQFPVYRGAKVMNPGEFAEPIVEEATYGPVYPTRLIGLGTTLSVGQHVTLDALVEHQGGHYLPNYTGYQNARRGVWTPCYEIQEKIVAFHEEGQADALNDVTALDRAQCAIGQGVDGGYDSDYWIESADFWRFRNVSLTFNVPSNLLRGLTRNATFTVSGQNLFTWTDYTGTDPEVMDFTDQAGNQFGGGEFGRRDYYTIPNPRTFTATFRVGF